MLLLFYNKRCGWDRSLCKRLGIGPYWRSKPSIFPRWHCQIMDEPKLKLLKTYGFANKNIVRYAGCNYLVCIFMFSNFYLLDLHNKACVFCFICKSTMKPWQKGSIIHWFIPPMSSRLWFFQLPHIALKFEEVTLKLSLKGFREGHEDACG